MNAFIDACFSHSRTVLTVMVLMVLAGISSYISIPKEADPDIPIPVFYVSITHPGISPEDAERLLIKPMEMELRALEGLEEITSIASLGHAGIILEFDVSFDKDNALADVREKVDFVRPKLPSETDEPTVTEFNTALFPVLIVTLSGDVPERTLYQHARRLKDEVENVSTVLEAKMVGHREELLEVVIDPARLESYQISQQELIQAITQNNRLIAAGSLDTGEGRFSVKVPGLIEDASDVYSLPIKVQGDGVVTLGDITDVRRTFQDPTGYASFNGKPAIALQITKRIGTNIIDNNQQVRAVVDKYTEDWPGSIKVGYTLDASDWIFRSLGSLENSIMTAIALVMVVVLVALGLRSALLVAIAIPTSFVIGFFFMSVTGITMNMMVMFGLLLSVGILVDGAIVVVEYADRKMAEGLDKRDAYRLAAKRMFWPIAASTGTTLAAFMPMLFWPGVTGKFMSYLPITVIVVLTASFITAMIFMPVLGGIFGKTDESGNETLRQLAGAETGDIRALPGFTGTYVRMLDKLVKRPVMVCLASGGVLIATFFAYSMWNNGLEFFVETEPEQAIVLVSARGNFSAAEALTIAKDVEDIVLDTRGVKTVFTSTGTNLGAGPGSGNDRPVDMIAEMMIELKPYEERGPGAPILASIRDRASELPGINVEVRKREDGPPTGKDIQVELTGENYQNLVRAAAMVRQLIDTEITGLIDIEDSRPLPGIEWVMTVDREMAGRFGADITTIGATVQLVTNGILVDKYRPDDAEDEVDIRVRFPDSFRTLDQFDQLRVQTNSGLAPLSSFVDRQAQQEVSSIERIDGKRRMRVNANTAFDPATGEKINVNAKTDEVEAAIAKLDLPPGISWRMRGANEEQQESGAFLGGALLAALFLMFIILLTQFNSFYHSVLTLSTVILSTMGVLLGMVITGQTFSVIMTGTGIVALAGIVVNNSIVLIDTYQRLLDDGFEMTEAVLRTAGQRLRPILLTTITTMFGLLPMALQINVGFFDRSLSIGGPVSAWWVQLATAIIFGLGFSTLLTLVLVPVLLTVPPRAKARIKRLAGRFRRHEPAGSYPAE